ncbi:hypothetical protein PYV00_03795 [Novosphingobium sp. H3SJ31-1]|uniref:Uncharacterized protein n=2 Tax=Novosphingobium album (ex Liu et al. 2023) TaxID=3031130 RepID=A0ABT5WLC1_9SPHN|nr:hypothetical protein [Novosphingobium album (ex Liu et al. 2023)]MDE8650844.1 hypothetical protein [Novosphingobium album (ex Liu et al. 2023)]
MYTKMRLTALAAFLALPPALLAIPASAQEAMPAPAGPTYADIAELADSAPLVVRAQVARLVRVDDARAPGLAPGHGRFYVTAKTRALIAGNAPIGESLAYLVDLPLDGRGKPPVLKKRDVLLFARAVAGRPGELQLVRPGAQLLADPATDARVRAILTELLAPGAPARITGLREIIHVPGNLAGEGETQIFLTTADQSAASITVHHRPGAPPAWGASFSELVADVSRPPQRDTLQWYRLACFLPNRLPPGSNLSDGAVNRAQAEADYRTVLGDLGECRRTL